MRELALRKKLKIHDPLTKYSTESIYIATILFWCIRFYGPNKLGKPYKPAFYQNYEHISSQKY